ncbi:hypothetical protein MW887_006942 [Aspergillus wentii]|nr:hypothetical protein MW887_006942 [Aspergillus wentii]
MAGSRPVICSSGTLAGLPKATLRTLSRQYITTQVRRRYSSLTGSTAFPPVIVPGLHRALSPLTVDDDEEQVMDHLKADDPSRQVATKLQGPLVKNVGTSRGA